MKKLWLGLACLSTVAGAAPANASATITYGSTTAIPSNNNFKTDLSNISLTKYAASGADIVLGGPSVITFYFLGSESGFSDTFQTANGLPNVSWTENSSFENHFGSPILIGSDTFGAGSLMNQLLFTNNAGAAGVNATVGSAGFGIFLGPNATSGASTNTFYFGYDDQAYRPDRDYDDFIVKAVVTAVPEPGTWAMMLLGFGLIGWAARRKTNAELPQAA